MKRFRTFSILALAVGFLASAAAYAAWEIPRRAIAAVSDFCSRARSWVIRAIAGIPSQEPQATQRAIVGMVRAKAFTGRLFKRERPVVMPDWRMCPSV